MGKGVKVDLGFRLQGWRMEDQCAGLGAPVGWREGQGHGDGWAGLSADAG